jgi:hypothetical protein
MLFQKPFVQVDDTYTQKELDEILLELEFLRISGEFLNPEETGSSTEIDSSGNKILLKRNSGVFLDNVYANRKTSIILKYNRKLFGAQLNLEELPPIFKQFRRTNWDGTLVSYYTNQDYYHAHMDNAMFTMVTYLYKQPKKFLGGELVLPESGHLLEPVFNRTYIFPSYVTHKVNTVQIAQEDGDAGYGRYCISSFLNFK